MSKNKWQVTVVKDLNLIDGTIMQQFNEYFKKHKKASDIINFLDYQDRRITSMSEINEKMQNEIVEFIEYYNENFYEMLYDRMLDKWDGEPEIFYIADDISYNQTMAIEEAIYSQMSEAAKKEAETLRDTLMNIRYDKSVSISTKSGSFTVTIPGTIRKQELSRIKQEVLYVCGAIIRERAAITVRLLKTTHDEIFGIAVTTLGLWFPVGADEMKKAHCTSPTGIELEPEDNTIYTEIQREKF